MFYRCKFLHFYKRDVRIFGILIIVQDFYRKKLAFFNLTKLLNLHKSFTFIALKLYSKWPTSIFKHSTFRYYPLLISLYSHAHCSKILDHCIYLSPSIDAFSRNFRTTLHRLLFLVVPNRCGRFSGLLASRFWRKSNGHCVHVDVLTRFSWLPNNAVFYHAIQENGSSVVAFRRQEHK